MTVENLPPATQEEEALAAEVLAETPTPPRQQNQKIVFGYVVGILEDNTRTLQVIGSSETSSVHGLTGLAGLHAYAGARLQERLLAYVGSETASQLKEILKQLRQEGNSEEDKQR